jgi:hypothetical protein
MLRTSSRIQATNQTQFTRRYCLYYMVTAMAGLHAVQHLIADAGGVHL